MEGGNDMPALPNTAGSDSLSPYRLYAIAEELRDLPSGEWIDDLAYTLAEIRTLPEARPVRYRA